MNKDLKNGQNSRLDTLRRWKKAAKNSRKRVVKKLEKQKIECEDAAKWLWFRQIGDSLLAEAANIKKGGAELFITNIHTQEEETIKLNPKLDAVRNAELFFRKAKKGKRGVGICREQIAASQKELREIDAILQNIDECLSCDEESVEFTNNFDAVRVMVQENGSIGEVSSSAAGKAKPPKVPYRHFTVDGWNVYVGKNNTQNDELSIRFAKPRDIWLHVAAHAGSHVIIRREKNADWPPKPVLEKVAAFAVWFSKAKHTSYAEVHYTEARYVHKRRKSPPGEVCLDRYKTVRVSPKSPQEMFKE